MYREDCLFSYSSLFLPVFSVAVVDDDDDDDAIIFDIVTMHLGIVHHICSACRMLFLARSLHRQHRLHNKNLCIRLLFRCHSNIYLKLNTSTLGNALYANIFSNVLNLLWALCASLACLCRTMISSSSHFHGDATIKKSVFVPFTSKHTHIYEAWHCMAWSYHSMGGIAWKHHSHSIYELLKFQTRNIYTQHREENRAMNRVCVLAWEHLCALKKKFNSYHSRTNRRMWNRFGMLKGKKNSNIMWRIHDFWIEFSC